MVILPSAVRAKSAVGSPFNTDFRLPQEFRGVIFRLKVTASGGTTPTLDVKFQSYDDAAAEYFDLFDTQSTREAVAFVQATGAVTQDMLIYPGVMQGAVAEGTTNMYRLTGLPVRLRAVCTYGADADETFTFSLAAIPLR